MSQSLELSPGGTFAADYKIVKLLAEGGMGAVYEVEQISTGNGRALKVMHRQLVAEPKLRERFEQEAKVASRIPSDHVVQVLTAGIDATTGAPYLVMELLQGEDLAAFMKRRGPIPAAEMLGIFEQLCHALGAAHDASIVHRDLKPENIFLTTPRRVGAEAMVKVLDFGIAKVVAEAQTSSTAAIGTPMWMAPEQTESKLGVLPATDVWALGLLAFKLLVGKHYWKETGESASVQTLMREMLLEPLVPASERAAEYGCADRLPPGFDAWFARCVVREVGARFANAREAHFDLRSRIGGAPTSPAIQASPPATATQASGPATQMAPGYPAWGQGPPPPMGTVPGGGFGAQPFGPPPTFGPPPQNPWGVGPPRPSSSGNGALWGVIAGVGAILLVMILSVAVVVKRSRDKVTAGPEIAPTEWNEGAGAAWADEDNPVPVSSRDPMWGSRLAPVTIVLFSDFQCPFCARLETTLTSLRNQYGHEKLRIVWKNNPLAFHKEAKPTAVSAMTVFELGGSKAFWQFHQAAFANMKELTPENHERWAREAGVDMLRYGALSGASPTAAAKVEADLTLGKAVGVTGTPACLINGVLLSGAQPIEKFQTVIDEQLRAAQAAAAAGTRADQIYNKLTRENKAKTPPPKEKDPEVVDDKLVWKVPVGESPALGPDAALVTIVEFSEFQCPFCAKVEPTLDTLRETYGDKLRIVWKHNPLPFHKAAVPAAQLSIEAHRQKGDAGFWKAHDLLFKNQQRLSDEDLIGYGATLGLSPAGVRRAITSPSHPLISADQNLADDVKATGTPHFFINGRRLTGAQPVEKFKTIIDEEIIKANGLLARGVAPRDLYDELTKNGKSGDPLERKTLAPPPADAPFRGAAGAPIVIHQFSDFQCPFCKRVEPTMDQVLEEYGSKVKIVWRHKPLAFHKEAQLAAEAAQEAYSQRGNAGFQQYHKLLFENQTALQRDDLEQYAERMGLNMAKFRQALDSRKHKAFVDSEIAASDRVGISGTPAFVINGYYVSGAQPYAKFKKVIDRALADSRAN